MSGPLAGMLVVTTVVLAGDPPKKPAKKDSTEATAPKAEGEQPDPSPFVQAMGGRGSKASPPKVYTNDDLKKMYGGAEPEKAEKKEEQPSAQPPAEGATEPEEGSALEQVLGKEAERQEHAQKIAAGEEALAAAKQRVADLEKRLLAAKNPLLAPPKPPEEGADQWQQAGGAERVAMTEQEIQAARDEVKRAEAELASLRGSAP